jgi:hypothetical protein
MLHVLLRCSTTAVSRLNEILPSSSSTLRNNHSFELVLRNTSTHGTRTRHTTLHHLQQLIRVVRTRPLLMLHHIHTAIHLRLLDQLAIGTHALLAVRAAELIRDERGGVQTSQGDELPAVPEVGKTLDVRLLLVARHRSLPVERRRQVVRELLLGVHGVDALSEGLGLLEVGQLRLHPDGVGVWGVGESAVDAALDAALHAVVAFAGSRVVPVPEDVLADDAAGDGAGLGVALALGLLGELGDEGLGVCALGGGDGVGDGVGEGLQASLDGPVILDGLELAAGLAGLEGLDEELVDGLEVGVGRAEDEGVVAGVDGGGDEGGSLGVSAGNGEEISAHNIGLGSDGNETVDVLADWDQDLTGHVAALLGTRCLVLNVNTSSTLLNEELGELHDGGQTTMSGIGISNDWAEVIDVGHASAVSLGGGSTLLALLAVVEKLCHEELVHFVGDGGLSLLVMILLLQLSYRAATHVWVIGQIWAGLVACRSGRG